MQLEIAVTDNDGKPVRANLAVAVTDTNQVLEKEPYSVDIASYILLNSDLKVYRATLVLF